jgi:hypothetical protein
MTRSYHLYVVRGTMYAVEGWNMINMKQNIYSCLVLYGVLLSPRSLIYSLQRPDYMS